MEKISYALGLSIAGNLQQSGIDELDVDSFARGVKHWLEGSDLEIPKPEAQQMLNKYISEVQATKQEKDQAAGKKFLEENAKKEGVVVLESGLQYSVLQDGNGNKPKATDSVKCHYHGTLVDGTVFDSSVQRGEPAVFPVNGVIPGWVEALQLMSEGAKWELFIPSELAYGERGAGNNIGPNTTLIFKVELIEIQ